MDQLGKQASRFIGLCLPERKFGYLALFVLVLNHSEFELALRLSCWIPDSMRKVLTSFEIFY